MFKGGYLERLPWAIAALGVLIIVGKFLWDGGAVELGWGIGLLALGVTLLRKNAARGRGRRPGA